MNIFDERIKRLQNKLIREGLKAYIIPATDPHMSEECAPYFAAERFYFCPFKGNDGTLLVTQDHYYIYTDGRYWVQAEMDLKGSECVLVYDGKANVPSMSEYIKDNDLYPLGLDASLFSLGQLQNLYIDENHPIKQVSYRFMVKDLPAIPKNKIFKLDESLLSKDRFTRVREVMNNVRKVAAKALVVTALDDIAYLLGYRGSDIECTPIFYSYLYIDNEENLHLFIDKDKLPDNFSEEKVILHDYDEFYSFLDTVKDIPTSVDFKKTNALVCSKLNKKIQQTSPVYVLKAVKGEKEIKNTIEIQELDGLALLKLMKFLEEHISDGNLNEWSIAEFLNNARRSNPRCFDLSFTTIAAVDANAAMMHYAPNKDTYSPVTKNNQLLLVDSGGQYYGGTTDTTRTYLLADEVSSEVKHDYTLTLKSQIALSTSIFEKGSSGHTIDIKAREIMWREGLDYKCGTGHGVGYISCVHEGPIGFRYKASPARDDSGELKLGHIITIEPGVYKDYKYGIRLENNLLVVPAFETHDGIFYKFETITYAPYDRRGIDVSMLDDFEINWYNNYCADVYNRLSKYLTDDTELLEYLRKVTQPISR